MKSKVFIIAGEASGDMYGASLIEKISISKKYVEFYGIGGDLMKEKGITLSAHITDLNIMGFIDIIFKLFYLKKLINRTVSEIVKYNPDLILFIDFSGFNQKIAEKLKKLGFKSKKIKFVSPQIWASRYNRIKTITKIYDTLICILPFEKEIYNKYDSKFDCRYVGTPILDNFVLKLSANEFYNRFSIPPRLKKIALFPGSRNSEIRYHLPVLLKLIEKRRDLFFIVSQSMTISSKYINQISGFENVRIVDSSFQWEILKYSDVALVKSGTTVLQAAITKTPSILFFKTSPLNFMIAKQIIKVKLIGLPNLIIGKEIIKELVQENFTVSKIDEELNNIILNDEYKEIMLDNLQIVNDRLGSKGALSRVADIILENL
ncbi:MAG: lipid-A-disaccharide synthase [Candidatus Delongbacteria bacterium]|nr:lipid-A-disaccharide synthase [Candidatus Delongbacteria bacterium]MBN2833422.1 lipid-A-disaccharide synthase [Candidatus Delongbacteria bacterium]